MSTQVFEGTGIQTLDTGYGIYTQPIIEESTDLSKQAHFVSPAMNAALWNQWGLADPGGSEGVRLLVAMAVKAGEELVALCGYRWVPTGLPSSHGTCEACLDIANNWISEDE